MTYTGSQAQAGRGSTLSIGATPTLIGEVKSAQLKRGDWQFVDITNLESGSDKEVLATIRDSGSMSVSGNRVPADVGQGDVETAYGTGALTAFVLQLPKTSTQTVNGDKYSFNAYVKNCNFDVDVTKEINWSVDLMISGAVTVTEGS